MNAKINKFNKFVSAIVQIEHPNGQYYLSYEKEFKILPKYKKLFYSSIISFRKFDIFKPSYMPFGSHYCGTNIFSKKYFLCKEINNNTYYFSETNYHSFSTHELYDMISFPKKDFILLTLEKQQIQINCQNGEFKFL